MTQAALKSDNANEPTVDWFLGIGLVVDQMQDDVANDLPKIMMRVASAHRAKDLSALKLACEAYGRHVMHMQGVADLVARQCLGQINRRPRA